ncbi:MAG: hypothetical protein K2X74_02510 [Acetobacteraceae bacterium]|nr:hypothetical protein [Acetobacteraceae bacterium]
MDDGLALAESIMVLNTQDLGEGVPPALRARLLPGEGLRWSGLPATAPHSLPAPDFWFALTFLTLLLWGVGLLVLQPDIVGAIAMLLPVPLLFRAGVMAVAEESRQPDPKRTLYAVTDRRALIVERRLFGTRVRGYGPRAIACVELQPRPDILADVVFRQGPMLYARHFPQPEPSASRWGWLSVEPIENPIGFFALTAEDAAAAAEALESLRARRLPRSSVPTIIPAMPPENAPP